MITKIKSVIQKIVQDSENHEVKLWAKWSYITADMLVSMGHFFGSLPVCWNRREHKMEVIKSRFDKVRWISTIAITLLVQIALGFTFLSDMLLSEDVAQFIGRNTIRGAYGLMSLFGALFHLHTAWKYKEFVAFINVGASFYESFQNMYATAAERRGITFEDGFSGVIKFFFLIGVTGMSLMTALIFIFKCKIHFLAPLFPICEHHDFGFLTFGIYFGLAVVQVWFCQVIAASIILYIDLFAAVVLVGHYMASEMLDYTHRTRRTTRLLLQHEEWYRTYNHLHLMVLQVNECIGQVFMPVHMLLVTFTTSCVIYGLVEFSGKFGISFVFICLTTLVLLGVYYVFLIGRGSSFSGELEDALNMRKLTLTTKYLKCMNRSCAPIRPAVGIFFPLKGQTIGTMLSTAMEFALDLMLM